MLFMDSSDCRNLSCNATVFPSNVDAAFTKAWDTDTSPLAAITSNRKNGQVQTDYFNFISTTCLNYRSQ